MSFFSMSVVQRVLISNALKQHLLCKTAMGKNTKKKHADGAGMILWLVAKMHSFAAVTLLSLQKSSLNVSSQISYVCMMNNGLHEKLQQAWCA